MTTRLLEWREVDGQADHLRAKYGIDLYEVRYEIDDGNAWWHAYVNEEPIGYFESIGSAKMCCEKDARAL